MKQIVLEAPGKFVEREAVIPAAQSGCAVVRIEKVGVCGSDFHAFAGRHPIYTYPRVIGHELSGIVAEVPSNAKGIKAGDYCAIEPYLSCGRCRTCLQRRNNCCEHLRLLGIHIDGGMQEYLSVPVELLHPSSRLSLDQLALIETLGIGAHAVGRSDVQPGQEAIVVGAGPIGIGVAQFAAAAGARVHIVETVEWRRSFVERMGFTSSHSADGRNAEVVFDATGNAAAMAASLNLVAAGGRLVFVGLTRDPICLDDSTFHRKEVSILASRNSFGLFPHIIHLIETGKIDTSLWVTDRMRLSDVSSKFQSLPGRETLIKAIVDVH